MNALAFLSTDCRPDVRFAPTQATPGDARAFERGYSDAERGMPMIERDLAAYRAGWWLHEKRAEIAADARGEDLWLARGGSRE